MVGPSSILALCYFLKNINVNIDKIIPKYKYGELKFTTDINSNGVNFQAFMMIIFKFCKCQLDILFQGLSKNN